MTLKKVNDERVKEIDKLNSEKEDVKRTQECAKQEIRNGKEWNETLIYLQILKRKGEAGYVKR